MTARNAATDPTTRVVARYGKSGCRRVGGEYVIRRTLRDLTAGSYLRVRGTCTEAEPAADGKESPREEDGR